MPQLAAQVGVFTARQIVSLAERKAGNPGLQLVPGGSETLAAPAYLELQSILDQLALTQTFTFKREAIDFYITGRNNSLPSNFWRVGFSDPCWIVNVNDSRRERFFLLDAQEFHSRFQDGSIGTPVIGYINRTTGDITVEPAPDSTYVLELHYYPWQPALATVDDIPWFPFSQYLVQALLAELYLHQDDTRWQIAEQNRMRLMKEIKSSMGDDRDRASSQLTLDPQFYRPPVEL